MGGQGDCALADRPDVAIIAPITVVIVKSSSIRLIGLTPFLYHLNDAN